MRCILIHNPASGRVRHLHGKILGQIAEALSRLGHCVELVPTSAPGSAVVLAREAAAGGADIVFACGGDGTVHEVIQGLVSERCEPATALGIIPLGSANALARHMGLSQNPLKAALDEVNGTPHIVPVGKLTWDNQARYFAVMAGAGPDGALVHELLAAHKLRLGRLAYYLHAARLFATRRFSPFEIEFCGSESDFTSIQKAVSAMAVRVDDLGGLFSKLTDRRGSMDDLHLRLVILRPPGWISLPLWFICGWLNLHSLNPFHKSVNATTFTCSPSSLPAVHFQADGEWLGRIPMKVSVVPNALRILLPSTETPRPHDRKVGCS